MANPQCEDGYVQIANEIFDALCRSPVGGSDRQVLDAIIRKTYGYRKKEDAISISQLMQLTNLSKRTVIYALKNLEAKNMVAVKRYCHNGTKGTNIISFQKDHTKWMVQGKAPNYLQTIKKQKDRYKESTIQKNNDSSVSAVVQEKDSVGGCGVKNGVVQENDKQCVSNDLCSGVVQEIGDADRNSARNRVVQENDKQCAGNNLHNGVVQEIDNTNEGGSARNGDLVVQENEKGSASSLHIQKTIYTKDNTKDNVCVTSEEKPPIESGSDPPLRKTKSKPKTIAPRRAIQYTEEFEKRFWVVYPARNGKKIGKEFAFLNFQEYIREEEKEDFFRATLNYADSSIAKEGKYVRDPERFIIEKQGERKGYLYWREWKTPEEGGGNGHRRGIPGSQYQANRKASGVEKKTIYGGADIVIDLDEYADNKQGVGDERATT